VDIAQYGVSELRDAGCDVNSAASLHNFIDNGARCLWSQVRRCNAIKAMQCNSIKNPQFLAIVCSGQHPSAEQEYPSRKRD
jgi:hypothetical protein